MTTRIRPRNVFEAIRWLSHDEDFEGDATSPRFVPTDHAPGTAGKIAVLARRVYFGLPLFHPDDKGDFMDVDPLLIHHSSRKSHRERKTARVDDPERVCQSPTSPLDQHGEIFGLSAGRGD